MMMKISAIIPVLNRDELVKDAIESALCQTLAPVEVIVVDDGSTDNSSRVAASYGDRVRLFRLERSGPGAARNRAAQEATGDWLAFLDSDDVWLADKLALQAEYLESHPEIDFLHTDGWLVKGDHIPVLDHADTYFQGKDPAQGDDVLARFLKTPIMTPTVMVRRQIFLDLGGFDPKRRYNEDVDFFIRLMALGHQVGYLAKPLAVIRDLTMGEGLPRVEGTSSAAQVLEQNYKRFPKLRRLLKPYTFSAYYIAGLYALRKFDVVTARSHFLRSYRFGRPGRRMPLYLLLLWVGGERGMDYVRNALWPQISKLR
jgi:glycosyltransferase involved in cell wall biosynthesis